MIMYLILDVFFFSQENLVFKSNPVIIAMLDSFWHSLFTFLSFDFWSSIDFIVHPVSLRFFIRTTKTLRGLMFFFCSYYILFSMKQSYLLTAKTTPDVNNSL